MPQVKARPPIKRTKFKLSTDELLEMYYWLKLIRAFDERLSLGVRQGKVRSGVYTGIGQEAIVVGSCFGLRPDDWIFPLHRDLGALLMKGVTPRQMMAQMFAQGHGPVEGARLCVAQQRQRARASSATPACSGRTFPWLRASASR